MQMIQNDLGRTCWKCLVCSKEYEIKGNCTRHRKKHGPNPKPFICPACGEAFERKPFLDDHRRRTRCVRNQRKLAALTNVSNISSLPAIIFGCGPGSSQVAPQLYNDDGRSGLLNQANLGDETPRSSTIQPDTATPHHGYNGGISCYVSRSEPWQGCWNTEYPDYLGLSTSVPSDTERSFGAYSLPPAPQDPIPSSYAPFQQELPLEGGVQGPATRVLAPVTVHHEHGPQIGGSFEEASTLLSSGSSFKDYTAPNRLEQGASDPTLAPRAGGNYLDLDIARSKTSSPVTYGGSYVSSFDRITDHLWDYDPDELDSTRRSLEWKASRPQVPEVLMKAFANIVPLSLNQVETLQSFVDFCRMELQRSKQAPKTAQCLSDVFSLTRDQDRNVRDGLPIAYRNASGLYCEMGN